MARIVIDARESGTTTGRYVDKLIEYMYKLRPNHEFVILTKADRVQFVSQLAPSFKVTETSFRAFSFGEQQGFCRQIQELSADLVHFPMVQQPVGYKGRVVTTMNDLTTIRFKDPTKNSLIFAVKQQVYKWVNKRVAHKSEALITYSEFVQRDVAAFTHVSPAAITVIPLAADTIAAAAEPVTGLEDTSFLLYVGKPFPHKNLGRLLDAFVLAQKSHPKLYLVLAGKIDANYLQYQQRVTRQNIPNVMFTGFISDAQLRWLYEHCAAYVFPSLSEGFGLPGLEAMTYGAPVVSSNATCLPEVYGDAAHYFDPLNIQDMAAKIDEILDNPLLREALIKKGTRQAAKYSWQCMAEQTLAVYEAVLS